MPRGLVVRWRGVLEHRAHSSNHFILFILVITVATSLFNISTNNDKITESFDCIRLCFNAICEYFVIKTVQVPPQNPTALSSFRLTTYKSPQTANKRKLLSILITLWNRYWFHQISTISRFMR